MNAPIKTMRLPSTEASPIFNPYMSDDVPTFDWIVVNQLLTRKRNGQSFFHRLLGIFKAETPKTLAEIQSATQEGDLKRIREQVHKLKGSCSVLGSNRLRKLTAQILETARAGDIPESEMLEALKTEVGIFITEGDSLQ